MTLKGLIPFALNCPHLEDICVDIMWSPFDLTLLPTTGSPSKVKTLRYRVSYLGLDYFDIDSIYPSSKIGDAQRKCAEELVEYLIKIFPMLETILIEPVEPMPIPWDFVERLRELVIQRRL